MEKIVRVFDGRFSVELLSGSDGVPVEMLNLRKRVYVEEAKILAPENLEVANDSSGLHCLVRDVTTGEVVGATHLIDAESSDFPGQSGIAPSDLTHCVLSSRSTVDPKYRGHGLFALMIYHVYREARIRGRTVCVAYLNDGEIPAKRIFRMEEMRGAKKREVTTEGAGKFMLTAHSVDLDVGCHRALEAMPPLMRSDVEKTLLADEIVRTVKIRIDSFLRIRGFSR